MGRKRNARYYRRHPEQALRQVASFDGRLQREFLDALINDDEARNDLMNEDDPREEAR
jgi:hypothetical protein